MRAFTRRPATWSLFLALVVLAACAGGPSAVEYYRDETSMRRETWPQLANTYPTGLQQWTYSFNDLHVRIRLDTEHEFTFELKLSNQSDAPITINWAKTYYINGGGYRYHVAHNGAPFWSPVSRLKPTTVGPGQTIQDDLQPAREAKRDGVWLLAPLTDPQISQGDWPNELTIVMPIVQDGVELVHRFDMDIDSTYPTD
ncbi:MAG: hypothetical protein K9K66_11305 [Desulfarculaceae bacterium]|nr:hypothetical protein [Desulfarculaceae bacterium]MCF8070797.1 hypothetical protein [Desulfarculaceae bacterium]MCF8102234.1 hypothetical protein [Desulfarculaceae bacterium]MCF8116967.1 hypothetical protein [Desulfarculaceae bacterium]